MPFPLRIDEVKVGDKVGWGSFGGWSYDQLHKGGIATVAKVTKNSVTLDNGMRFSQRGKEIGGGCELYSVKVITEGLRRAGILAAIKTVAGKCESFQRSLEVSAEDGEAMIAAIREAMKLSAEVRGGATDNV